MANTQTVGEVITALKDRIDEQESQLTEMAKRLSAQAQRNAELSSALFVVCSHLMDKETAGLRSDDPDVVKVSEGVVEILVQLQGAVDPTSFKAQYGVDPATGKPVAGHTGAVEGIPGA